MRAHTISAEPVHLGFQIAPMIDVVFVIMLFFMVMAGAVKVEMILNTTLPGAAVPDRADEPVPPDEIVVLIAEDGTVTMNEEEFDSEFPSTNLNYKKLPALTANLT